jgi:hypothetical protein
LSSAQLDAFNESTNRLVDDNFVSVSAVVVDSENVDGWAGHQNNRGSIGLSCRFGGFRVPRSEGAPSWGRPMSDSLKRYMVTLATDLDALGAFIINARNAIKEAGLSEEDAALLTSGDQTKIYIALSGMKLPIPTQPAAQQGAPVSHPASPEPAAAQHPSPTYPVVVGWIGPTAQPSSYFYPVPPSAYPTQGYPSQGYPPQAYNPGAPPWANEWLARYWASLGGPTAYAPSPAWPASWQPMPKWGTSPWG